MMLAWFSSSLTITAPSGARMGIVPVFAVGQEQGVYYSAMQYIDGQNLRAWIESDRRRPLPIVIRILSTVTRALIAAHALGISYGNLKPSNIVLVKNNVP